MGGIQLLRHAIISEGLHFRDAGETPIRRYQQEPFYFSAILRRGIIFSPFSVPPSFASLLLLSTAMSASNPSLTSVVFSLIPVSFETFLIRLSSMFKVVLILPSETCVCINMHNSYIFCQEIPNQNSAHASQAARQRAVLVQ